MKAKTKKFGLFTYLSMFLVKQLVKIMKTGIFLIIFFFPLYSIAQVTSQVTTDRANYVYGEVIKVTMTITNNTDDDAAITYRGSSTTRTVMKSFSGIELLPDIWTTDEIRNTVKVGETREIRWQLDPKELALPITSGKQTVVVRALNVVDSVSFNAPEFTGGKISFYFKEETETEKIEHLRDSLNAEVLEADHPGYLWELYGFKVDSVIADLLQRDYVLEASVPARGSVSAISHTTLTGIEDEQIIPDFTLAQNYPNPFNPSTTISFSLERASLVELSIYDLSGRKLQELVNRKYPQGKHSVVFDASYFSSGTYIYQLKTESGVASRKLTLVK